MVILITCFVCSILLFFPIIYEYAMGDFLKGILIACYIGLIPTIYQSRREYDKEIFILTLLKDSKTNWAWQKHLKQEYQGYYYWFSFQR